MKLKVCGMRSAENISELIKLKPDFIGFIFYEKSKRFVSDFPQIEIPESIKKVGVFVNETIKNVVETVAKYNIDIVQLHGDETPAFCKELSEMVTEHSRSDVSVSKHVIPTPLDYQIQIIKAFSVDGNFDFNLTEAFEPYCDLFLFDTKGKEYGGNGTKFNWKLLKNYSGQTPFLLSGGITKRDVIEINKIKHSAFIGVDINSGFEIEPAVKNIEKIKEFKNKLQ